MTKTFKLNRVDNYWYGTGQTKILCQKFIQTMRGETPDKLTVVLSDEPTGGVEVKVFRTGYYRWSWRLANIPHSFYGMRRSAEDIVGGFFNKFDQKGNVVEDLESNVGKVEQTLWLSYSPD